MHVNTQLFNSLIYNNSFDNIIYKNDIQNPNNKPIKIL